MRGPATFSAEGRMNTKDRRIQDCKKQSHTSKLPSSYKNNSIKEELCFEYISSFNQQFLSMYPKRRLPYMTAQNECGVKKFVGSTLRPTQLPYSELYDMYECASFLSGYILYEPLASLSDPPHNLFSPSQTLISNVGDCFDISALLCSFLLGAGYDAYVVYGYAPNFISLRDQSMTLCPMISGQGDSFNSQTSSESKKDDTGENTNENSYIPIDNSVKDSAYLKQQKELKITAATDTFELWIQDTLVGVPKDEVKRLKNRCMHAWVLVCAGKRDVKEHVFLESSTGRAYSMINSPYLAVEGLWNNVNYWVHLHPERKINEIDFDLKNVHVWEVLFIDTHTSGSSLLDDNNNDSGEPESDDLLTNSQIQKTNTEDDINASKLMKAFDAPPTWVDALYLERKNHLLRYPPYGKRSVQYFCSKVDFFSRLTNSQCLVMRITCYLNRECTILKEIHEWYENRKDKLYKRVRYYLGKTKFVEHYHPGSEGEVKQWTEYPGKQIEIDFHVNGRLDRLKRREEYVGRKVVEYFEGRTDQLIVRCVDFTTDKYLPGARLLTLPGGGLAPELYVLKMNQDFERNPKVIEGTDVARRAFYIREGKLIAQYHFGKGNVFSEVKTYFHARGNGTPIMSEFAIAQEVGVDESTEALQEAATLERECYTAIKLSFQQIQKIHEFRQAFEGVVITEKTVFDAALDKANDTSNTSSSTVVEKSTEKVVKEIDYLTPFLRHVKNPNTISREEALEIRQNCLDSLKTRLIERANIIQSRLNEENAKLGRKQEQFQRSQREGDLSTEEYEKYCTEAMFRIQILEQRLVSHEETALKKFAELDSRLALDVRLKCLRS